MMKYMRPEMEFIRFENADILTDSDDTPDIPAVEEPEPDNF